MNEEPRWKRPLYLSLTTFLGLIFSYGVHALLELWYLNVAPSHGWTVQWTKHFGLGSCALPVWLQYGLVIAGLIGGWLIGHIWWRWVYVEHRRWRAAP